MSLQSREEMISLHNTQSDTAAVALITSPFNWEPQVLLALIRHTLSQTRAGGKMNAPVSKTKYPPVPLVPLFTSSPPYSLSPHISVSLSPSFPLPTLKPHQGLSSPAQDKFCLHQDGGGGRRVWTKDAFIAVGSGWLRTDNGHILQLLKQIAVCSLPC